MIFDWNMAKKVNIVRVTAQRYASMYGYCNLQIIVICNIKIVNRLFLVFAVFEYEH